MMHVGTAGWALPRAVADRFPGEGAHLARYARVFSCAEINSTFRHEHRPATYARWAAATPDGFKFSVKLPEQITHRCRLEGVVEPLDRFLGDVAGLGERLGPLLVQLPGSLDFAPRVADTFFGVLRRRFAGPIVCEPRHPAWFGAAADRVYLRYRVGRVGADPARFAGAEVAGGWLGDASAPGLAYFRLHGAPRVYWSSYTADQLAAWAGAFKALPPHVDHWCVFDNTAGGAAAQNALDLAVLMRRPVDGVAVA